MDCWGWPAAGRWQETKEENNGFGRRRCRERTMPNKVSHSPPRESPSIGDLAALSLADHVQQHSNIKCVVIFNQQGHSAHISHRHAPTAGHMYIWQRGEPRCIWLYFAVWSGWNHFAVRFRAPWHGEISLDQTNFFFFAEEIQQPCGYRWQTK
jgi:hypothetical protein